MCTHTKVHSFACECGYTCATQLNFARHQLVHSKIRHVICSAGCGQTFTRTDLMKRHLQRAHSESRSFPCAEPGCAYAAKTSADLSQHKRIHGGHYTCQEAGCTYKATQKRHIKAHMLRAHSYEHKGGLEAI